MQIMINKDLINATPFNQKGWLNDTKKQIKIYDTTLRDGEQTIGVSFNKFEKLEIALMLDEAGVDRIEAGMPVVSKEDLKAVQLIVRNVSKSEVWGFSRCVKKDIDACVEAGVKCVICEMPLSQFKHKAYGYEPEAVLEKIVEHLQYAKSQGLYTAFFGVDATRTDADYLKQAYTKAVKDGGANEVVIADTVGAANPEAMAFLTSQLCSWVNVPVMIHCHNDFGLATACTMAGLRNGAAYAQVTVNGLGEKTGNADLAEILLAGQALYDMPSNVDWLKLRKMSARVAQLSGVPVSPLKSVTGRDIFKKESGVAVAQMIKYPTAVESYGAELVGAEREVVLSKKSGRASVEYALNQRGIPNASDLAKEVLEKVKQFGAKKGGPLESTEFDQIVAAVLKK